jgi:hypothetical protein
MSETEYRVFLKVSLAHDYYADGVCPDLTVQATTATADLLRRRRHQLRAERGGFSLICPVSGPDAAVPPEVVLDPGTELVFGLLPSNPAFCYVTELPGLSWPQTWYMLNSQESSTDIVLSTDVSQCPPDPELRSMKPLFVLVLRSQNAVWPTTRDLGGGKLTLNPLNFRASFTRRQSLWRYHIIKRPAADNVPNGADPFTIRCRQPSPPYPMDLAFNEKSFPEVAAGFPGQQTTSFESNVELPFYERPLKDVELCRGSGSAASPVIKRLPNPPRMFLKQQPNGEQPARFISEVYLHV